MTRLLARFLSCSLAAALISCAPARAEMPTTHPFAPITFVHEVRKEPDESLYIVTVDLTDRSVNIHVVPGGADPDGAGPWQTTLMPARQIAQREHFAVAINASFFSVRDSGAQPLAEEVAEQRAAPATMPILLPGYVSGKWSSVIGWTMTDGRLWSSRGVNNPPVMMVNADRSVQLTTLASVPATARQIVAGNAFIVRDGVCVADSSKARHPRTAIGIDKKRTQLSLLTLDGRRPGVSDGMTLAELGAEMKRLGCFDALNLDGGGSTTLVMRDPQDDSYHVINQPSDRRERPVADVIGISVEPQK